MKLLLTIKLWLQSTLNVTRTNIYASTDMWAMGAIMAELFTLRPLFPGTRYGFELNNSWQWFSFLWAIQFLVFKLFSFLMDSEADEIYKICSVIGSPTTDTWADGLNLARTINYQFPQVIFSCFSILLAVDVCLGGCGANETWNLLIKHKLFS